MFNEDKIHKLYPGAEKLMIPTMLIWKLPVGKEDMMQDVCSNGNYFAEEKIDGAWYQFTKGTNGELYLFGRTISRKTDLMTEKGGNVPHILEALDCFPNGTALIGEMYYPGGTAKNTVSVLGCLKEEAIKRQDAPFGPGPIHYYVHDIIFYDGINLMNTGAWDRYLILKKLWKLYKLDKNIYLRLASAVEDNIEEEVARIIAAGGEGMVLKKRNGIYTPGKRPAWNTIKFKQIDSADLVCTRTIPATREYSGENLDTWMFWEKKIGEKRTPARVIYKEGRAPVGYEDGIILVDWSRNHYGEEGWEPVTKPYALGWHTAIGIGAYDEDGKLKEIGTVASGLSDSIKAEMAKDPLSFVGRVALINCMSKDKEEQTLRHPVFAAWHFDKNPKECKLSEVFN